MSLDTFTQPRVLLAALLFLAAAAVLVVVYRAYAARSPEAQRAQFEKKAARHAQRHMKQERKAIKAAEKQAKKAGIEADAYTVPLEPMEPSVDAYATTPTALPTQQVYDPTRDPLVVPHLAPEPTTEDFPVDSPVTPVVEVVLEPDTGQGLSLNAQTSPQESPATLPTESPADPSLTEVTPRDAQEPITETLPQLQIQTGPQSLSDISEPAVHDLVTGSPVAPDDAATVAPKADPTTSTDENPFDRLAVAPVPLFSQTEREQSAERSHLGDLDLSKFQIARDDDLLAELLAHTGTKESAEASGTTPEDTQSQPESSLLPPPPPPPVGYGVVGLTYEELLQLEEEEAPAETTPLLVTEAQPEPQPQAQPEPQPQAQPEPQPQAQPEPQPQAQPEPQPQAQPQPQTQAQPEPQSQPQAQPEPQPQTQAQPEPQTQAQPEPQTQAQPDISAPAVPVEQEQWPLRRGRNDPTQPSIEEPQAPQGPEPAESVPSVPTLDTARFDNLSPHLDADSFLKATQATVESTEEAEAKAEADDAALAVDEQQVSALAQIHGLPEPLPRRGAKVVAQLPD